MLEDKLNQDIKQAMLAGDKFTVEALRTLKSTILYAKVAAGVRDQALPDSDVVILLQKEAKKRQESADLYKQGGSEDKARKELDEKTIIERYLPAQISVYELEVLIDKAVAELGGKDKAGMGAVISLVRQQTAGTADGGLIARIVKERLAP